MDQSNGNPAQQRAPPGDEAHPPDGNQGSSCANDDHKIPAVEERSGTNAVLFLDRRGRQIFDPGDRIADHEDQHSQHDSRNDSREEQLRDGGFSDQTVQDQRDRRWDQNRDCRRRCVDGSRETLGVALFLLNGDQRVTKRRRVRHGGTRNAAEEQRADNRHLRKPTFHGADQHFRESYKVLSEPARHHQVAGKDEEWDRQHRKAGRGLVKIQDRLEQEQRFVRDHGDTAGDKQRVGHGRGQQQQCDKDDSCRCRHEYRSPS